MSHGQPDTILDADAPNNPRLDPFFEMIGAKESNWLFNTLANWWMLNDRGGDEYRYQDNTRIARKGDPLSEKVYEDMQDEGCCGSVDVVLGPSPGGHRYLFGFNYGH